MKNPILLPQLRQALEHNDKTALEEICSSGHPAVIADFLSSLSHEEIGKVLFYLNPDLLKEIFSHLEENAQIGVTESLSRGDLIRLVTMLPPDDRVDLLKQIPEDKKINLLPALAQAEREDIMRLSSYPEGTAGSIMTSEYAVLPGEVTAGRAIDILRMEAPNTETIYYAYIVDKNRRLNGFISLKDLILSNPAILVQEIMQRDVICCHAYDDQEEATGIIAKYDLLALPVVNRDDSLVGIITHDDAIDVINQEYTEDMEKIMAITGSHETGVYLSTPSMVHFKNRVYWVVALAVLSMISGLIVHTFEATLTNMIILALYMPMLADTGGNTGSQAATVVIRSLALNEVSNKDLFKVLFKEFKISLLLAVVLGAMAFTKVYFFSYGSSMPNGFSMVRIAFAISLALSMQVVTATLMGALLPMIAEKFNFDPAVVASPALTTVVDITGLLIYFGIAKLVFGI